MVLSGRKQAGKNTLCNYLHGLKFKELGMIKDFEVSEATKGQLVTTLWNGETEGVDLCSLHHQIYCKYIKDYAYADELKLLCENVLLLSHNQLYGSNDEKNSLTKYLWQDMPGLSSTTYTERTGFMTAREILQFVGTEIFRKMHDEVWVEACLNKIKRESPELAIVTDCRFPNEVVAAQRAGAKVIRLTRNVNPDDTHLSENALNSDVFDWKQFDHVIDNQEMSIEDNCYTLQTILEEWGWL